MGRAQKASGRRGHPQPCSSFMLPSKGQRGSDFWQLLLLVIILTTLETQPPLPHHPDLWDERHQVPYKASLLGQSQGSTRMQGSEESLGQEGGTRSPTA